jgi:hypothetical protein
VSDHIVIRGRAVIHSQGGVHVGSVMTPQTFECWAAHRWIWDGGGNFNFLCPPPVSGPGPHRIDGDVRLWWSEQNLAKTAADLDAYMDQPRERWSDGVLRHEVQR